MPIPTYTLCIAIVLFVSYAFGSSSINEQHSGDVINYLWWTVGVFGVIITAISGRVTIWAITTIIKHEKEITGIKAACHYHRRSTDNEDGSE